MSTPDLSVAATKYVSNPIIARASLTAWYSNQVYDPQVFTDPSDATKNRVYVSGSTSASPSSQTIGLFSAAKSNPYSWSLVGQVLTASGAGGSFDETGVRNGTDCYIGSTYYLFYTGVDASGNGSIGLATSANGTTFTRQGQILSPTGQGRNDGTMVSEPAVIRNADNTWTMLYSYRNGGTILPGYRAATCGTDPAGTWTKSTSLDDVFVHGSGYHEFKQLFKVGSTYYIVYEYGESVGADKQYQCYLASSASPLTAFSKCLSGVPWIPASGTATWDRYHTATPSMQLDSTFTPELNSGVYLGYYCGANDIDPVTTTPYWDNQWPPGMVTMPTIGGGTFSTVFAGVVR